MDIDEMPAGREMDALIAEKVMGWEIWNCQWSDKKTELLICNAIDFEPSTDIAAAWEVVEKIKDTNMDSYKYGANSFELSRNRPMQPSRLYACRFNSNNNGYSYAETASLAICRAALKAVGVNEI